MALKIIKCSRANSRARRTASDCGVGKGAFEVGSQLKKVKISERVEVIRTRSVTLEGLCIERCCQALGVSRAAYYKRAKLPSEEELVLVERVRKVHEVFPSYGYRRMSPDIGLSEKSTRTLMRRHGLQARLRRRRRGCTHPVRIPKAANLMTGLDLSKPSRVFACDVTEIRLRHRKAYLATLMDVCTRQILGWNLSSSNDTALTMGALNAVLSLRKLEPGWVHHSDRGSNYGADLYRDLVFDNQGLTSYSDPGSPTQNAYAESFFSTFKLEAANEEIYENLQDAKEAVAAYISLYNSLRRHSSIGCKAPDQYYAEICLR